MSKRKKTNNEKMKQLRHAGLLWGEKTKNHLGWKPGQACPLCLQKGKTQGYTDYLAFRKHFTETHGTKMQSDRQELRSQHFERKETRKQEALDFEGEHYVKDIKNDQTLTYISSSGKFLSVCPHPDCNRLFPSIMKNGVEQEDTEGMLKHYTMNHRIGLQTPYRARKQYREYHATIKNWPDVNENIPGPDRQFIPKMRIIWNQEQRAKAKINRSAIEQESYDDNPILFVFHKTKQELAAEYERYTGLKEAGDERYKNIRPFNYPLSPDDTRRILQKFTEVLKKDKALVRKKDEYCGELIYVISTRKDRQGNNIMMSTRIVQILKDSRGYQIHKIRCPECRYEAAYRTKDRAYVCINHDRMLKYTIEQGNPGITILFDEGTGKPYILPMSKEQEKELGQKSPRGKPETRGLHQWIYPKNEPSGILAIKNKVVKKI